MLVGCLLLVMSLLALLVGRLLSVECLFSKLLIVNTITSVGAIFICLLAAVKANSTYLDIAIIYFLLSSIASAAYLRYFTTAKP